MFFVSFYTYCFATNQHKYHYYKEILHFSVNKEIFEQIFLCQIFRLES